MSALGDYKINELISISADRLGKEQRYSEQDSFLSSNPCPRIKEKGNAAVDAGDVFAALGGVAALVAAGSFIGKIVVEKFADGTLKRFEHSMALSLARHQAELAKSSAAYQAELAKLAEAHKTFIAFSSSIDVDLRERRVAVYEELWKCTSLVPRWPRNSDLLYEQVAQFSRSLRSWYFEKGGMFLSESARAAYGKVQEANDRIVSQCITGPMTNSDYDDLMNLCSALRTRLTSDLRSRGELPVEPE